MTSGTAREVFAGALSSGGECCIEDGEEFVHCVFIKFTSLANSGFRRFACIVAWLSRVP
jgi:hypothetical protein